MKFCKDCIYYTPAFVGSKVYVPSQCRANFGEKQFDPVTGNEIHFQGDPYELRKNEEKCGIIANWFEPKE
ncbi:hypothetical protein [Burkholderia territorii]|uniref:hypothetical protein n=1 Tax=Burkholderia territorii TaxID=1503055 RepID=UPI000AFD4C88|nr:hypothetical protein [Burkholderia territorii]